MSESKPIPDKEYSKMMRPFWLHVTWCGFVVAVALVGSYSLPWAYNGSEVVDTSHTLLALNGTLLALVVGFSTFYFTILESRRQQAIDRADKRGQSPANPQTILKSGGEPPSAEVMQEELDKAAKDIVLKSMMSLVATYRASMRAISKLLVAISLTYGFFLAVSYCVYLYALAMSPSQVLPAGAINYAFSLSIFSPAVTVLDAIIMTYYLTSDVAGRSIQRQLEAMQNPK